MSYVKLTSVSGYDTTASRPKGDYESVKAFADKHWRNFQLRGHWDPRKALAYARRHGVQGNVKIEHTTSDPNGKGYGSIDARFVGSDDGCREVTVSTEESDQFAEQQSAEIWEDA